MRFTGTYDPIPYLINRTKSWFPGISDISAFWISKERALLSYSSNSIFEVDEKQKPLVQEWRNKNHTFLWTSTLFIDRSSNTSLQQTRIEDEQKLNCLTIFLTSPIDNRKDILTLKFPENFSLKSSNHYFSELSTQEKTILQNLVTNFYQEEYKRCVKEKSLLKQIEKVNNNQVNEISNYKEKLALAEEHYQSVLTHFIESICDSVEKEMHKTITVAPSLIEKIAQKKVSYKKLKSIIEEAAYTAFNLNFTAENIHLTKHHVDFAEMEKKIAPSSSFDKARDLLDRFEASAEIVKSNQLPINGKNIASHLQPPVTPPAITDAVKKNEKKINYLLGKNPDLWPLIREGIKPLQKMLTNTAYSYNATG